MVSSISGISSMMSTMSSTKTEGLTDEQKSTIQSILSEYDPENVTTEDAQAIFQAFEDAGISPTRGMKEAIEAAGFDAEDLRSKGLDEGNMPPPPPPDSESSSTSVNATALQDLQDILSQYDLSNLSEEDENTIMTQLQEQGFIYPGSVVDVQS